MTDQDRLADIKARMEASFATPTTGPQRDAWMRWIDTMRDDVPWLVGECERLREEVAALRKALDDKPLADT